MIELFCFLSYFLSVNIRSIRKCFITEKWQIVLMAGFKEVVQVGTLSYFFFPNKPGLFNANYSHATNYWQGKGGNVFLIVFCSPTLVPQSFEGVGFASSLIRLAMEEETRAYKPIDDCYFSNNWPQF